MPEVIRNPQNRRVKFARSLCTAKGRAEGSAFIAEGFRVVDGIPSDRNIMFYLAAESVGLSALGKYGERAELYVVDDRIFGAVSDTKTPQGIIAVCEIKKFAFDFCAEQINPFYVLLDNVNDPGNLGAAVRTCDAAGASGIFVSRGSADVYNPKAVRASAGSVFHLPIYTDVDIKETIGSLRKNSVGVYAADADGAIYPYGLDLTKGCAFVIGNEGGGLNEDTATMCDASVKVPIAGKAESLNASVACGVLLYEAVRQRMHT
jgi:TrmH family RNA methyltransferase